MDKDLKALWVLNELSGFGIQTLKAYLKALESPAVILDRGLRNEWPKVSDESIRMPAGEKREFWAQEMDQMLEEDLAEKAHARCAEMGIQILGFGQANYPQAFYSLYDPPILLYASGNWIPDDLLCFAIVGTRNPSPYGIEMTRRFSSYLAQSGLTIVSGFARGIDAEAHRGALEVNGRTVAILGCGVDQIYPAVHEEMYRRIRETGTLLSEYAPGAPPLANHFPRRNRLISGLSLGVLVVEAHEKSGSLITAACALEQGKEVFAIPGRIDSLRSRGTNRLIKSGACLVERPEEILAELEPVLRSYLVRKPPERTEDKENTSEESGDRILEALRETPLHIEELVIKTAIEPDEVYSRLTRLEIQGRITRRGDGRFASSAV